MIYLDNAATGGYKPQSVQNAVLAAMKACANPGRSGHRLAVAQAERVLACRNLLCELFDGYSNERVVFTKNCTEAMNLALLGCLEQGDHVVISHLEHNAVVRPLEHLKRQGVITYDIVPLENGILNPESFAARVTPATKLCCVTAASNVTGLAPDLIAIRKALPPSVLLVVDGAQGAGHLPISMKETGIDALTIAGHKGMGGIQGAGALLFSERMNPRPVLFGGTGSESFNRGMPAFYPDRLESGTLSYPAVCSLYEGALLVQAHCLAYGQRLQRLTEALLPAIAALGKYKIYSAPNRCGIVSFAHVKRPSEEVAGILSDEYNIAVRGGLHCAPLAHEALSTMPEGLVRASFSPLQGMREANALIGALRRI